MTWRYNQSGVTYNDPRLLYNGGSPGPTFFTPPTFFGVSTTDSMSSFTPPSFLGPQTTDSRATLADKLQQHYPVRSEGRAVWQLIGGTLTFQQPDPTLTRADVRAMFGTESATYEKVYLGGHVYVVEDQDEIAALSAFLTAEGYDPNDWLT